MKDNKMKYRKSPGVSTMQFTEAAFVSCCYSQPQILIKLIFTEGIKFPTSKNGERRRKKEQLF